MGQPANNNQTEETELLEYSMTKITVLSLVSYTITFLTSSSIILRFMFLESLFIEFFAHFMITLDVYTNFVCIMLSYKYYSKIYGKICCIHTYCTLCWRELVEEFNAEDVIKSIHTLSTLSSSTEVTSSNDINATTATTNPGTTTTAATTIRLSMAPDFETNNYKTKHFPQ